MWWLEGHPSQLHPDSIKIPSHIHIIKHLSQKSITFNELYSLKYNAKFILRIDDTDQKRNNKYALQNIKNTLKLLEINYDKKIVYQSKRNKIYIKYAKKLITENKAYICICSKNRIDIQ